MSHQQQILGALQSTGVIEGIRSVYRFTGLLPDSGYLVEVFVKVSELDSKPTFVIEAACENGKRAVARNPYDDIETALTVFPWYELDDSFEEL